MNRAKDCMLANEVLHSLEDEMQDLYPKKHKKAKGAETESKRLELARYPPPLTSDIPG